MAEYKTGLVNEVEDMTCYIYDEDQFATIVVYAYLDKHGNQIESSESLQKRANKIATILSEYSGDKITNLTDMPDIGSFR